MKISSRPLSEQRWQLLLLALLGVGLAVVVWQQVLAPAETPPSASNPAAGQGGSAAGVIAASSLPSALRLAALEPVSEEPAAGRNPFRFGVPPPPPPRPAEANPVAAPPPGPPPPPPGPPPPPAISLKFVAVMQLPAGHKVASLSDGKGIMVGREGDVIDGRYRIVKIGVESIVMEYLDGRGRQTIPLRGTEP